MYFIPKCFEAEIIDDVYLLHSINSCAVIR